MWFTLLQGVFGVGLGIWERVGGDRLYDFDSLVADFELIEATSSPAPRPPAPPPFRA